MRTEIKEIKIYKFEELSATAQERVAEDIMSDYFWTDEALHTLKECIKEMGCKLTDYSFDLSNATLSKWNLEVVRNLDRAELKEVLNKMHDLKLTGVFFEYSFYKGAVETLKFKPTQKEIVDSGIWQLLTAAQSDYESQLEFENIKEHCDANDYEFLEDGTLFESEEK